jgi:hypothetical protein
MQHVKQLKTKAMQFAANENRRETCRKSLLLFVYFTIVPPPRPSNPLFYTKSYR